MKPCVLQFFRRSWYRDLITHFFSSICHSILLDLLVPTFEPFVRQSSTPFLSLSFPFILVYQAPWSYFFTLLYPSIYYSLIHFIQNRINLSSYLNLGLIPSTTNFTSWSVRWLSFLFLAYPNQPFLELLANWCKSYDRPDRMFGRQSRHFMPRHHLSNLVHNNLLSSFLVKEENSKPHCAAGGLSCDRPWILPPWSLGIPTPKNFLFDHPPFVVITLSTPHHFLWNSPNIWACHFL